MFSHSAVSKALVKACIIAGARNF